MKEIARGVKTFLTKADMFLLTLCVVSTLFGMVLISSAARTLVGGANRYLFIQGVSLLLGIILYIAFTMIDVEHLATLWKWILLFSVLFILSLIPFGVKGDSGNKSWLRFLGVGIQPAEVVKVTFVILMAKQMTYLQGRINHVLSIGQMLAHLGLMVGLIHFVSADDGVAIVYVFIFFCMALCSGIKFYWFLGAGAAAAAALPLLWNYVLREDQRERILISFNPELDPLDRGYHAIQSQIALGAGKLFGRGLYHGPQTQYNRLPAKHTDFIFSVAGEELGLVGCIAIVLLLTAIIIRCLYVATKARSTMSSLVCVGLAGMLIFQTVINIGMCIGLFPIIGLTLPFFSYGGSSIITLFAAMGIVSGVHMRPMPSWLKDRNNA